MTSDVLKLFLVNVYMPFEGDEDMTADFADQLSEVENLVSKNNNCHVVMGGYFTVNFSRNRLHLQCLMASASTRVLIVLSDMINITLIIRIILA